MILITNLYLVGNILNIMPNYLFVLQVCTAKMNLSDEVDLEDYVSRPDKISAAEVRLNRKCCVLSFFRFIISVMFGVGT